MLPHAPTNVHTRAQNRAATDAGDHMNHDLLTRTATPEAHCLLLSQSPPPSHSAQRWARVRSEFTAACEARMHRRLQGVKPCEARSERSDGCTWMNVWALPVRIHPVRPPSWTRLMHRDSTLPGLELTYRKFEITDPARRRLVRLGP